MFNYKVTLEAMRRERASMQMEVEILDQAIAALQALVSTAAVARTKPRHSTQAKKTPKVKRKISAQGLQNIIRAQNKRWAKARAAAKRKARATSGKKAVEPSTTKKSGG
jgi:hypothetical protein